MKLEEAQAVCAKYGSVLQQYEMGRVALLVLPSHEPLIISIGTITAKVLTRRAFGGWIFPKTVASKELSDWIPDFNRLSAAQRFAGGAMVLDGLLSLTARARNVAEISLAWIVLRDPVEVAVAECGWGP
jgi:hypothetical protein